MPRQITTPSSGGQDDRIPEFQFRGGITTPEIFKALQSRQINTTDFVIYCVIDAFMYSEEGCFASNAYIGRAAGIGRLPASRSISKLVKLDFVRAVTTPTSRRLFAVKDPDYIPPRYTGGIPGRYTGGIPPRYTLKEPRKDKDEKGEAGAASPPPAPPTSAPDTPTPVPTSPPSGIKPVTAAPRGERVTDETKLVSPPVRPVLPQKRKNGAGCGGVTDGTPVKSHVRAHLTDEVGEPHPAESPPVDELIPPVKSAHDARPKCVTSPVDQQRAATLRAFAAKHGWTSPLSPRNWAEPLALLRRAGVDDCKIDAVLSWYVAWYAPGKKPAIQTGKQFREHWNWLCDVYAKENVVVTPLDADEQWVLKAVRDLEWPDGLGAQLDAAVAASVHAVRKYVRAVRALDLDPDDDAMRKHVLGEIGYVADYVEAWFRAAFESVRRWDEWNRDVTRFVWRPDHKLFVQAVAGWVDGWGSWAKITQMLA